MIEALILTTLLSLSPAVTPAEPIQLGNPWDCPDTWMEYCMWACRGQCRYKYPPGSSSLRHCEDACYGKCLKECPS